MDRFILASGSQRRINLLKSAGFDPIIIPSKADENLPGKIGPREAVMFLALKKALSVEEEAMDSYKGLTLVSADTIVALGDEIMGKPRDKEHALEILMSLSGKIHKVYTGVVILKIGEITRTSFVEETVVQFRSYSPQDLEDYLNTDEPYDKAGAYAIQGYFGRFVEKYEGEYNNVIGLPTKRLIPLLCTPPYGK